MSSASPIEPQPAVKPRWLSIIGIGEDGIDSLTPVAHELIRSAAIVFGGDRHLSLAAPLIRGTARLWAHPFDSTLAEVLAQRGRRVCVLASGDPFFYGVGSLLARRVDPEETIVVPAPSAFSLAAARLLWSLDKTTLLSLCGRSLDLIRPHLQPGARILILTSDSAAPAAVARLLCSLGFGNSTLCVLESLAGPRERIRCARANQFDLDTIDPLNTLALTVSADQGARIVPRTVGLADDLFEHDGQITKREIRALTLSALAPRRGEHLWDVGAGSGSVAIEWMLSDPSLSAVAVERRGDRAARVIRNAAAFGVPNLEVVEGSAPAVLQNLTAPDAAFIGGGATAPGVIDTVQAALRSNGRLVVNAVTLESEAVLLGRQTEFGGTLTRIDISRASPIGGKDGRLSGWRPSMPVMQWAWTKP